MNKTDFVAAIAEKTGLTKVAAEKAVAAYAETVKEALAKGDKVQLIGFGTFEVRDRAAREARSPRTGEIVKVEACKVPAFKASSALKDALK